MYQNGDGELMTGALHNSGLVKSESMDISNDPRFFTDNIIDKRLAAFGGLSVVSGLMVQNAMSAAFTMRKNMDFTSVDGIFQFVGFTMVCCVLYGNTLSTYVGVIQPYHTYRLMTAGPTGFETAAAYYLQKDIVAWRHFSVKLMLLSMPLFIISSGFRFVVKFDRDAKASPDLPVNPPLYVRLEGLICCLAFISVGLALFHIHWRHEEVFRILYNTMFHTSGMSGLIARMQNIMSPTTSRLGFGGPLDV